MNGYTLALDNGARVCHTGTTNNDERNDMEITQMEEDSLWTLLGEGPQNLSEDERNALGLLLDRLEGLNEPTTSGWVRYAGKDYR